MEKLKADFRSEFYDMDITEVKTETTKRFNEILENINYELGFRKRLEEITIDEKKIIEVEMFLNAKQTEKGLTEEQNKAVLLDKIDELCKDIYEDMGDIVKINVRWT